MVEQQNHIRKFEVMVFTSKLNSPEQSETYINSYPKGSIYTINVFSDVVILNMLNNFPKLLFRYSNLFEFHDHNDPQFSKNNTRDSAESDPTSLRIDCHNPRGSKNPKNSHTGFVGGFGPSKKGWKFEKTQNG